MNKRRLLTSVLDQACSSLSNMLVLFAIARVSPPSEFGSIALAYTILIGSLSVSRGALGTPLALRAGEANDEIGRELSFSSSTAIALGLSMAAAFGIWQVFFGYSLPILLMGCSAPIILTQDVARYAALAHGRPQLALVSDALWTAISSALFLATTCSVPWFKVTPAILISGWMIGGGAATVVGYLGLQTIPRVCGYGSWLKRDSGHRARFAADGGISALSTVVLTSVVTALVGPTGTAALRGAGTIIGPMNVFLSAAQIALVPEIRRMNARSSHPRTGSETLRMMIPIGIGLSTIAALAGVVSLLLPSAIGTQLLGRSWVLAQPIMPIVAFEYIAQSWLILASTTLRSQQRSRAVLGLRLSQTTMSVATGSLVASVLHSPASVALASAGSAWVIAGIGIHLASKSCLARQPTTERPLSAGDRRLS